jgi:hypothetical protein
MDQGPVRPPPTPPWNLSDVRELSLAVLRQLLAGVGLAGLTAVVWAALGTTDVATLFPLTLVLMAAIMPMFTFLSVRVDMSMHLDRLGQASQAPGDEDADGLTSAGTFLFVSIPMALLGAVLGL